MTGHARRTSSASRWWCAQSTQPGRSIPKRSCVRYFAVSDARRISYGNDPAQFGELHLPRRTEHRGTVVIIHGGFWRARYDLDYGRPLAADLAAHGFTAWNVEYRRVGNG